MNKPVLYPNQLFMFENISFNDNDDSCYVNVIMFDGTKKNFKVVEPIPVDKSRTVLEGSTKNSLLESIKKIINTKYTNKNIYLDDETLDKIEEDLDKLKLSRKDKRKKFDELEKIEIDKVKEKLKEEEFKEFFTSRRIYQANGMFLSEKGGLLQIPGDSRYKLQNIHVVTIDNPLIDFTFQNKQNKILKIKDIDNIDNESIRIRSKINFLSSIKSYQNVFKINEYLINKIADKKNKKTNSFDIYNLISFYIKNSEDKDIKEYSTFLYKEFNQKINTILNKYKQLKEEFFFSPEDKKELTNLYRNFFKVVILNEKNDIYNNNKSIIDKFNKMYKGLVPPFLNINVSIFIYNDKKKDFINYFVKTWKDKENSMFNIIKNKEKVDYFQCLDELELKDIVGVFNLTKVFDDYGKDTLHPIYTYPKEKEVKKATPRLMGYSIMDNSFIPNIEPPAGLKLRGFVLTKEVIDNLKKNCQ